MGLCVVVVVLLMGVTGEGTQRGTARRSMAQSWQSSLRAGDGQWARCRDSRGRPRDASVGRLLNPSTRPPGSQATLAA